MRKILFISIVVVIHSLPAFAAPVQLHTALKEKSIGPFMEYLEDKSGTLTYARVRRTHGNQWIRSGSDSLDFGYTGSVYWVRFSLQNGSAEDITFYLEQDYPLIDSIELYVSEGGRSRMVEAGHSKPFSQRPYQHRNFVFPMKLKGHSLATYYLRFKAESSLNIILRAWSPEYFRERAFIEYLLLFLFYGTILVMILYNLFISIFIRRVGYLYYVLFILFYLLSMMSQNGTAYQFLYPDFPRLVHFVNVISLMMMILFLIIFCSDLVELKRDSDRTYRRIMYWIIIAYCVLSFPLFFISLLILPFRSIYPIIALFTGFVLANICIFGVVLIVKEGNRASLFGLSASSAVIVGGLLFILKSFGVLPTNFFTEWSSHIGSIVMVIGFSYALADRINTMGRDIQKAERKYRELVESSDDIIFSMDDQLTFLSVNQSMTRHLGFSVDDVVGKNFFDFIHETLIGRSHMTRLILEEYIMELKQTKKSVTFRADFRDRYFHEPKELLVKLEYAGTRGEKEKILGKASSVVDDIILQYLESERQNFIVDNFLYNAELISQRLTRSLGRYCKVSEIGKIRMALREALINAIEHGNLGIHYEEKALNMNEGLYLKFLEERQRDPRFRNRRVRVEYLLSRERVEYRIADEGDGFDHKLMMRALSRNSKEQVHLHGRGLLIVKSVFNTMKFSRKGNRIVLVKRFTR